MFWRRNNKEQKKPRTLCLQRFQAFFTTVDGVEHEGTDSYKWVNSSGLICAVPEYMMININSDGYLVDMDEVMYPLQNIISIKWKLIDQKVVLDNFYHEWQVFFDNKEVAKMDEYKP